MPRASMARTVVRPWARMWSVRSAVIRTYGNRNMRHNGAKREALHANGMWFTRWTGAGASLCRTINSKARGDLIFAGDSPVACNRWLGGSCMQFLKHLQQIPKIPNCSLVQLCLDSDLFSIIAYVRNRAPSEPSPFCRILNIEEKGILFRR